MQIDLCDVSNCVKKFEMINLGEDWDLKCKDHSQFTANQTCSSLETLNINSLQNLITSSKQNLEKVLEETYQKFTNKHTKNIANLESLLLKLQEKITKRIKELKDKIQSFQDFKEKYLKLLNCITKTQYTDIEKTKTTLFEMNALKQKIKINHIESDSSLEKYSKQLNEVSLYLNKDKYPSEHSDLYQTTYKTIGPHINLDNSALSYDIISVEKCDISQIERWRITRENIKILSLKLVRNASEVSEIFIQKEITLINQYPYFFPQIYILDERNLIGYYSVYIEPLENQLKNKFSVENVQRFLYFIRDFINTAIGFIEVACIDPSIIGYHKNQFYILDFKYMTSPKDKNYSAPEVLINESVRPSSSFIYTSGLIAIEMLGQRVAGFNILLAFELVIAKIQSLRINDELKLLLVKMINPEKSLRITRAEFTEQLNSPTLFS